jgi:hypothetical protein
MVVMAISLSTGRFSEMVFFVITIPVSAGVFVATTFSISWAKRNLRSNKADSAQDGKKAEAKVVVEITINPVQGEEGSEKSISNQWTFTTRGMEEQASVSKERSDRPRPNITLTSTPVTYFCFASNCRYWKGTPSDALA